MERSTENICLLGNSREKQKYKLKTLIELTHKMAKIQEKKRILVSSSFLPALFIKQQTSLVRPEGLP